MTVLKLMLKLAVLPLYLLLILVQWTGIFLTTFSSVVTNLLAGLFFFTALACWVMRLADGGDVLKIWNAGMTRCSTSSVPRWSAMPGWRSWRRTSNVMRIGGLRCLRRTKMTNTLMPCKLETMIYAIGDGTYSVFTLNSDLQKQLADLAVQHPKMCWNQKSSGMAGQQYRLNSEVKIYI